MGGRPHPVTDLETSGGMSEQEILHVVFPRPTLQVNLSMAEKAEREDGVHSSFLGLA